MLIQPQGPWDFQLANYLKHANAWPKIFKEMRPKSDVFGRVKGQKRF
jgi:hypothetical protein